MKGRGVTTVRLSATDYVEAACLLRCSFQREEKNHSNNTTRKGLIFLKAEVFRVHIIHTGETRKMLPEGQLRETIVFI